MAIVLSTPYLCHIALDKFACKSTTGEIQHGVWPAGIRIGCINFLGLADFYVKATAAKVVKKTLILMDEADWAVDTDPLISKKNLRFKGYQVTM